MSWYYKMVGFPRRVNYWSNSKLASKIRKWFKVTPKPSAATREQWAEWRKENEGNIGYQIAENILDELQDIWLFIPDVFRNAQTIVVNRFIDKTHLIDTGLKRGEWHDVDTRMLHGMFQLLNDFVEKEKTQLYRYTEASSSRKLPKKSRDLGLKYLDWEISLGDESPIQSQAAQEIKDLYLWWNDVRPNRPNPWDDVKVNEDDVFGSIDMDAAKKAEEIEAFYEQEDTEKLIQLIKLRKSLWT